MLFQANMKNKVKITILLSPESEERLQKEREGQGNYVL